MKYQFTQKDIKNYKDNGYLVSKNFFKKKDIKNLIKWTDEIEKLPTEFELQWSSKSWTVDEVSDWISKKFDWVFNSLSIDQVGTWEDSGCSCCAGGCACCQLKFSK